MHSKKFFAVFFVLCMLSTDFMIPAVLGGGNKHQSNHGIELLLAAGILAKLLRKKHHGHHHHGHHHHHHEHKGRHAMGYPEVAGRTVEVVHVAPPMGGYSSHYPTTAQSSYGQSHAASTSFSASVEYPFNAASHSMPIHHHMSYASPVSAASFIGYEPHPVQVFPPMPFNMPEQVQSQDSSHV